MRILVAEDDPGLRDVLVLGLQDSGYHVDAVERGDDAIDQLGWYDYDVAIIDWRMPGAPGIDVIAWVRKHDKPTAILMLTARDTVDDRVSGLDAGADDYLTKPFAFRELVARVRALARREAALVPETVRVADLEVDFASRGVRRGGRPIRLTAKEFALLEYFARHVGQVVDRAAITAHVWDENHDPFTNVLEVLIRRLRRKIDDAYEPKLIHTLRGAGYRFGA